MTEPAKLIDTYIQESCDITMHIDRSGIVGFVTAVLSAYDRGSRVFVCGNGGNAAAVANLVVDLNMHPFVSDDKQSPAYTRNSGFSCHDLCSHGATLTGIMNDFGSAHVFSQQLVCSARADDVLVCFTGSGRSPNIIAAAEKAHELGMVVLSVTKNRASQLVSLSDTSVFVDGTSRYPGQTGHNDANFHFEDVLSKVSHIVVGALWEHVREA